MVKAVASVKPITLYEVLAQVSAQQLPCRVAPWSQTERTTQLKTSDQDAPSDWAGQAAHNACRGDGHHDNHTSSEIHVDTWQDAADAEDEHPDDLEDEARCVWILQCMTVK